MNIYNIVMTQTGEIRRKLKTKVANENKEWAAKCAEFYRSLDIKTYTDLQAAFLGGWTHANAIYTGRKMENIPRILSTRVSHAYIWIALSVIAHKDSDICKDFLDKRHKICYHIIGKIVGNDLSRF